ncbi:hypothetical protein PTKIN_Ptkin03bG0128700 [Pterospermum kingtungense]
MGTKLECAINPLTSSQNSNSCSFTVHFVDDYFRIRALKDNCEKIRSDRFGSSMDRVLEMESIRKTMQMHEDIFRHQVRELHRLYSVQKMLMDELKKEIKQKRFRPKPMTSYNINPSQFNNQHQFHVQGDPSSREKSGSCSNVRIASGFDLERPAGEDISAEEDEAGHSSLMHSRINQMSIQGSDDNTEVELTLSIGGSSSKKMPNNSKPHNQELGCTKELDSSTSFTLDRGEDCSGPNTPMSSSSTTFDQEKKRSHWLFQGLSINRT